MGKIKVYRKGGALVRGAEKNKKLEAGRKKAADKKAQKAAEKLKKLGLG